MDKLQMQSKNLVDENIEFIAKRFPNCVTEALDEEGKLTKLVDFDMLKQELSHVVIDGDKERYTMTWPDKKQAILTANAPIAKTLRPCKEESVGKDGKIGDFNSQNIYIEGDNLDVLKLLRETYLGKIKMIYIDPPYNTGNDFVYNDDFSINSDEYLMKSNQLDQQGNKMVLNNESNGRFHTDWLNMIYPRLKMAKDLLSDDGVIFISIDDNEQANMKKICDEIFGESNFITKFIWEKTQHFGRQKLNSYSNADYIFCYAKCLIGEKLKELLVEYVNTELQDAPLFNASNNKNKLSFPVGSVKFNIKDGIYENTTSDDYKLLTPVVVENSKNKNEFVLEFKSRWSNDTVQAEVKKGTTFWVKTESFAIRAIYGEGKTATVAPKQIIFTNSKNEFCAKNRNGLKVSTSENATNDLNNLLGAQCFSYPKPVSLILYFINLLYNENKCSHENEFTILDFFSGSGTTAHATILANSLDNGNRKFIAVQLPENLDENLAKAAGNSREIVENAIKLCDTLKRPHNLTEVGKERIRRAGQQIKGAWAFTNKTINDITKHSTQQEFIEESTEIQNSIKEKTDNLDIGFRCLKLDSSCMKDIYYSPNKTTQDLLTQFEDNIKEDRTPEDLLFQVMLDMGVMLSSEIKTLEINGKKVFNVNDGDLVCCFDKNINDDVVTAIAKMQPLYAVFRDASMSTDSVSVNFDQIFETYSPTTTRKVL